MDTFSGASWKISFMQLSQNIDGFRTKWYWFTWLLELIQLYKQNPLEKILIFTIYQNYTSALIIMTMACLCQACLGYLYDVRCLGQNLASTYPGSHCPTEGTVTIFLLEWLHIESSDNLWLECHFSFTHFPPLCNYSIHEFRTPCVGAVISPRLP